MRKRLWQLHSWLGLFAGLGLLLIGLSGSLLVFHVELAALFSHERHSVAPTPSARLPLDVALRHIEAQLPNYELTGWHLQNNAPTRAQNLYIIQRGTNEWLTTTFDPYTGRVLDTPHRYDEALHGWLVECHSSFFTGDFGIAFAGLLAVALCLLGLSGVYLYREFWRHLLTLRWGRGSRILFSDLHKFVGIVSVPLNLVLGFTGAYWNITHTAEHLVEEEHAQAVIERRLYPESLSLEAVVADSATRLPGFRAGFVSLPSDPAHPSVILWGAVEPRPLLAGAYSSTVSYEPATGAHVGTGDFRTAGPWIRLVDTFEALHFGAFGGQPTKILWCLAGLSPAVLSLTGFTLWRLRRRAPSSPRTSARDSATANQLFPT